MKILYIIRGLPGSGKTTLAKAILGHATYAHCEADQYFETAEGYKWHPEGVQVAHQQCQNAVEALMIQDTEGIVVSNTFTRKWEYQPYEKMAEQYGYRVFVISMAGPIRPNVHDVPPDVLEKMRARWEH